MSEYSRISTSEILTNRNRTIKILIYKFKKEGTKRIFFAPEHNGKRLSKTMFARLRDARTLAKNFIKYKSSQ